MKIVLAVVLMLVSKELRTTTRTGTTDQFQEIVAQFRCMTLSTIGAFQLIHFPAHV